VRPLRRRLGGTGVPFGIMRLRPMPADVALAILVSVPAVASIVARERTPGLVGVLLILLQTAPLAWRRVQPLAVLAVTVAATLALFTVSQVYVPIGVALALYTVAGHRDRPVAIRAGLLTLLALAVPIVRNKTFPSSIPNVILLALFWTAGAYLGELRARAARAEREREAEARRAVAEEQARIARELHDVIAHNVSVMVVQAAAGADVFDHSPERAREALTAIEATGRQALAELRRLLDTEPGEQPLTPQPGLAQLGALAGQVRAAGLQVELRVEGDLFPLPSGADLFPLPSGADLSAYRIVQEALTNTLKHAHATTASVLVRYHAGEVALEVRDDGHSPAAVTGAGDGSGGRGIIGMRERAALYGGRLEAGPEPGGGFAVRAVFPIEDRGR